MRYTEYCQRYWILFLLFFLTGCATSPIKTHLSHLSQSEQAESIESWEIHGKLSILHNNEATNARLSWAQYSPHDFDIALSGPLNQGGVLLSGNTQYATLTDAKGRSYRARDPQTLLYQHTGWDLPVLSLYYWAKGLPDPHYPKQWIFDETDRLKALKQHGWILEYDSYQQYDGYTVPRKIRLYHGDTQITLLLTQWQINPDN